MTSNVKHRESFAWHLCQENKIDCANVAQYSSNVEQNYQS